MKQRLPNKQEANRVNIYNNVRKIAETDQNNDIIIENDSIYQNNVD